MSQRIFSISDEPKISYKISTISHKYPPPAFSAQLHRRAQPDSLPAWKNQLNKRQKLILRRFWMNAAENILLFSKTAKTLESPGGSSWKPRPHDWTLDWKARNWKLINSTFFSQTLIVMMRIHIWKRPRQCPMFKWRRR